MKITGMEAIEDPKKELELLRALVIDMARAEPDDEGILGVRMIAGPNENGNFRLTITAPASADEKKLGEAAGRIFAETFQERLIVQAQRRTKRAEMRLERAMDAIRYLIAQAKPQGIEFHAGATEALRLAKLAIGEVDDREESDGTPEEEEGGEDRAQEGDGAAPAG